MEALLLLDKLDIDPAIKAALDLSIGRYDLQHGNYHPTPYSVLV